MFLRFSECKKRPTGIVTRFDRAVCRVKATVRFDQTLKINDWYGGVYQWSDIKNISERTEKSLNYEKILFILQ